MKGFIRILEAILASLILISSLSYFFATPSKTKWDVALLQANVEDTLLVLDKSNLQDLIIANNKTEISNRIRLLLPDTIDFSVLVSGMPNPEIFIGCNCSNQEITSLKQILGLDSNDMIRLKERSITVKVKNESIDNIDKRTDILFLFDYEDLTPNRPYINDFLVDGGTVFMLAQIGLNPIDTNLKEIFGLEAIEPSATKEGEFYDTQSPSNTSFRIFDYFVGVNGNVSQDFGNFELDKIDVDDKSIIVDRNLGSVSYAKVNYDISANGKGRAVWIGDYDYASNGASELNTNKLVTALVLWGSGEEYSFDPIARLVPDIFQEYSYVGVLRGFEPFEIRLKVWSVFY